MDRTWIADSKDAASALWLACKSAGAFAYYGTTFVRQRDWDIAERVGQLRQALHDYDGQSFVGDRGAVQNLRGNVVGALGEVVLKRLVRRQPGIRLEALAEWTPSGRPDAVDADGVRVDAKTVALGGGWLNINQRAHHHERKRPNCYAAVRLVRDYVADVYLVSSQHIDDNPGTFRLIPGRAPYYSYRLPKPRTDDLPELEDLEALDTL